MYRILLRSFPTLFILLCLESALPFFRWHNFQSVHPFDIVVILTALACSRYLLRSNQPPVTLSVVKRSLFLILVCLYYVTIIYVEGNYNLITHYEGPRMLVPWVKLWPYLQFGLWALIGIALCVSGYARTFQKAMYLGLFILLISYSLHIIHSSSNISAIFHNSYMGCISHILLAGFLYRAIKTKRILKKVYWGVICAFLFIWPFLGALRGASFISVVIVSLVILAGKGKINRVLNLLPIFIGLLLVYFIIGEKLESTFIEHNPYGYSSTHDVLSKGFNPSEETAQSRMRWWSAAINSIVKFPVTGHSMTYSFRRSERSIYFTSENLHNYYISALVDGGIVLLLSILLVLTKTFAYCFQRLRNVEDRAIVVPLAWLIAILLERFTNTYAFEMLPSRILSAIMGFAIGLIVVQIDQRHMTFHHRE